MSNLPPNPYNITNPPQVNANSVPQYNHSQPMSQLPPSQLPPGQLPPGYVGLKQDTNSNSPLPPSSMPQNSMVHHTNNFNQSASSSPAFNHPGMMPPPHGSLQSSPNRPPLKPPMSGPNQNSLPPNIPPPLGRQGPMPATSSPLPFSSNFLQKQINDNAPPLIPSSHSQPLVNGPPMAGPPGYINQASPYPVSSSEFAPPMNRPPVSSQSFGPGPGNMQFGQQGPQSQDFAKPPGPIGQPNVPFSGPPLSGPPRHSPLVPGPPTTGPPVSSAMPRPPTSTPQVGPPRMGMNGPTSNPLLSSPSIASQPPNSGPPIRHTMPPMNQQGPLARPPMGPTMGQAYPGSQNNGPSGPLGSMPPLSISQAPPINQQQIGQAPAMSRPPISQPPIGQPPSGQARSMGQPPMAQPPMSQPGQPPIGQTPLNSRPPMGQPPIGQPPIHQSPIGQPPMHQPPMNQPPMSQPPIGQPPLMNRPQMNPQQPLNQPQMPPGPQMGQPGPMSNMQGRYPPFGNPQQQMGQQYPQQYGAQGLTQQMGQLSVTKQGFDQLWGHQAVDLMACRHILPEYPEDPPEIRLTHQFAESPNCSPEIFRCTINKIPDTSNLLKKSRLPLGILIHPFKDLNHLPVIQCTTIVRCRACRTYINPFVYFVDAKRWKCNLCYRVNDLPEEFQYDPVSKSYGDPSRRPEIKSATIEFIAPGEYMLRPPQPAVYLFLMDVSQIAKDSGYLQVFCDTLKNNLDQLPGDARTQVGFICYDAHIHYYLMSDGLTRPKEMTVIDVDDVFLPSPESLLVNLGERKELVKELLTVLPQRHSGPATGASASALGAALQAAYKLMAPTGGRVTVFQTCLPNVGPGALQAREDPNARSSSDVQHLSPATDFYKRIALDCSGAQVSLDLFLLNAQYADLATLSGMSKFSAGTVYHIPLFKATRSWQTEQFTNMLTRYLTRKIGFEAVMRVRCTRGISIHTFHGNLFVRSTDLLSLPNVSPDAGFAMQLTIDESLADMPHVCFQAALLYTSSKGERRIRVHTLALPVCNTLTDVLHSADQHAIIGLLSKIAVDRCASASISEAREALINVAVDMLSAHRLAQNLPAGPASSSLLAPVALRLVPLYLLALLKRKAFRTGTSTRLDDRVADMCDMKTLPLQQLMRAVYPDLYPIHCLRDHLPAPAPAQANSHPHSDEDDAPDPPRLHLSAERINLNGAYLLDDGTTMIIYICHGVSTAFLSDTFGVAAFSQIPDEARTLPRIDSEGNILLHAFIDKLNDDRPYASNILLLRDNSPSKQLFTERLVDDRVESSFAYYEFLQHIKQEVK